MSFIKNQILTVLKFIFVSSGDPTKASASVKFALLGLIPYAMQATQIVCQFGSQCYDLDANILETIINAIAEAVFYILSLVAVVGAIWQAWLKLYRTAKGNNLALKK